MSRKQRAKSKSSKSSESSKKPTRSAKSASARTSPGPGASFLAGEIPARACLTGFAALLVATPLIPGEAAAEAGAGNPLAIGWLALAASWLAVLTLQPKRPYWFGGALAAIAAFAGWHAVSLFGHAGDIHMRPAVNMTFVWLGAAACIFSAIQLFRSEESRRAIMVALLVLAGGLSLHGLHQYFISMPATATSYEDSNEQAKQRLLRSAGVDPTPGSTARKHFEDRLLDSTEPFATFGLANSLAGFLAPALVLLACVGWREFRTTKRPLVLASLAAMLFLVLICLMLTKSRSAYLAAFAGGALWLLLEGLGNRMDWKWPLLGGSLIVIAGLVGVVVGALDIEVLSESGLSVRYRLEYWRATAAMIADSPWLGCGPGQFQTAYTKYKLPEASETVADPHNFLLEVWSTVGTPGLLLLLIAIGLLALERLRRSPLPPSGPFEAPQASATAPVGRTDGSRVAINLGAALGIIVALPAGAMVDQVPDLWSIIAMAVAFVLATPLMWNSVAAPTSAIVASLTAWAINLLAAGGFNFPGVAVVGWLLFALLIAGIPARTWSPPQIVRLAVLAAAAVLVLAGMQWATKPLEARAILSNPLARNSLESLEQITKQAAQRDPLWADPWNAMASGYHARWLQSGRGEDRKAFASALAGLIRRDPQSWIWRRQAARWWLTAWRAQGQSEDLEAAIAAYQDALERYPASIELHADLAWSYHLAGSHDAARDVARRAMELDALHPHREHKLSAIGVFDPGPGTWANGQPAGPRLGPAEPVMEWLRRGEQDAGKPQKSGDVE